MHVLQSLQLLLSPPHQIVMVVHVQKVQTAAVVIACRVGAVKFLFFRDAQLVILPAIADHAGPASPCHHRDRVKFHHHPDRLPMMVVHVQSIRIVSAVHVMGGVAAKPLKHQDAKRVILKVIVAVVTAVTPGLRGHVMKAPTMILSLMKMNLTLRAPQGYLFT